MEDMVKMVLDKENLADKTKRTVTNASVDLFDTLITVNISSFHKLNSTKVQNKNCEKQFKRFYL